MTATASVHQGHADHKLLPLASGRVRCVTCHQHADEDPAQQQRRLTRIKAMIAARLERERDPQEQLW